MSWLRAARRLLLRFFMNENDIETHPQIQESNPEKAHIQQVSFEELELLRSEMAKLQDALEVAKLEAEDLKSAAMRAKAEVQTIRRRAAQDELRAREQGSDSMILTVLPVYDDLKRALDAAKDDPSQIIPGVERVRDTLKRNLEMMGIHETGMVGEVFDPHYHEALTSMPTDNPELKGKIAQIFEAGFVKDERVVRVARVVVYQD
ncbi:MAG: nucleotide exchange factor GrpE [Deinococcales bacterium]